MTNRLTVDFYLVLIEVDNPLVWCVWFTHLIGRFPNASGIMVAYCNCRFPGFAI